MNDDDTGTSTTSTSTCSVRYRMNEENHHQPVRSLRVRRLVGRYTTAQYVSVLLFCAWVTTSKHRCEP